MTPHPVDLEALTAEAKEHMRYGFRSRVLDLIAEVRAARQTWLVLERRLAGLLHSAGQAEDYAGKHGDEESKGRADGYRISVTLIQRDLAPTAALASPSVPPPQEEK